MYCKYCGKKIDDDSIFCSYCGKNISKNSAKYHEDESLSYKAERIIKDGIIYENDYSVGKVPRYCNPHVGKLTEYYNKIN